MSLNTNALYATNPVANIQRSRFDLSETHTTTFDTFEIVPCYWSEILPGDSWTVDTSMAVRLQTLLNPIFSDVYMDIYWFYVPNRLLWENWQRFLGDSPTPWFENYTVNTPQIEINFKSRTGTSSVKSKTVADYLGCPLAPSTGSGTQMRSISHLPFRAYSRIYNEWWRSEVVDNLTAFNASDSSVTMNNTGDPFYGGPCLVANKFADQFTRALPAPQRGSNGVMVGLEALAPVITRSSDIDFQNMYTGSPISLHYQKTDFGTVNGNDHFDLYGLGVHHTDGRPDHLETYGKSDGTSGSVTGRLWPSNLYADLTKASGVSINELRLAFATQRYLEKLARSGSRYIEYLSSIWGVTAPDQRLQRSEFLGGNRIRLNVNQVISNTDNKTSTTGADLGDLGAYSLTTDSQNSFTKSFVEHGIIMALACVRWKPVYQNGYDPKWFRTDVYSYYNPVMANIGEQPYLGKFIYADGGSDDEAVFGYNEAWLPYRAGTPHVSGEMRSDITNTLDSWHLADDYSSRPYLSSAWLKGDKNVMDRVLAVSSSNASQVLADFYFKIEATRAMPIRSIPGLTSL